MKHSIFLNDMLTKGAILGAVMMASSILETSMIYYGGGIKWLSVMTAEIFVAMAVYIWLTLRFTKGYAKLVLAERKNMPFFTFGNGFAYVVSISMLAGIIAALGGYLFRHYVIGFENYVDGNIKLIQDIVAQTEVPSSMVGTYDQLFESLKKQSEPSIFSAILSGVWTYLVAGSFVGLFIAPIAKREPKIFDEQNEQ